MTDDLKKVLRQFIQKRLEKQIAGQSNLRQLTLNAHALQKARNEARSNVAIRFNKLKGMKYPELEDFLDYLGKSFEAEASCAEVMDKQKLALNEAAIGIGLISGLYMGTGLTWEEVEGIMADPYWVGLADSLQREFPQADN